MSNDKLALTKSMLEEPKTLSGVFDLAPFRNNFIQNYRKVTGNNDGSLVWEREKMVFLQKLTGDEKFQKCTRMSVYGAFTQLATSGLSLVDDQAYLIPYKDVMQFQIGWKGRLEQIARMDFIKEINEPMVVYKSDDFDYTLAPKPSILKHKRKRERPDDDELTHVYIIYETDKGTKTFIMERHEIEKIRDNFSETYKFWKSKNGQWAEGKPMALPFALQFPEKYFKKTCVKTLYNSLPKTQEMKNLDNQIKMNIDADENASETQDVQHEVMEHDDVHDENFNADQPPFENADDIETVESEVVDESSVEIDQGKEGESF